MCVFSFYLVFFLGRLFGRPRFRLGSLSSPGQLLWGDFWPLIIYRSETLLLLHWCCMCKQSGESVNHMMLHCSMAWELWSMILGLFGVHWVIPCHVLDLRAGWQGRLSDHRNMVVWKIVPHCLMWCLWRERNARHFEDCERSTSALKLLSFQTLYEWVFNLGLFSINSMVELIDLCTFWFLWLSFVYL